MDVFLVLVAINALNVDLSITIILRASSVSKYVETERDFLCNVMMVITIMEMAARWIAISK